MVLYSDSVTIGIGGDGGEIFRFLSMTAGLEYLGEQEDKFLSAIVVTCEGVEELLGL